jgi:hypothetical protein
MCHLGRHPEGRHPELISGSGVQEMTKWKHVPLEVVILKVVILNLFQDLVQILSRPR